jgi:hypothetical protein
MKVGDLVTRMTIRGQSPRAGLVRGICHSVDMPDEQMVHIVWLDNSESDWISEYWLKDLHVISERR